MYALVCTSKKGFGYRLKNYANLFYFKYLQSVKCVVTRGIVDAETENIANNGVLQSPPCALPLLMRCKSSKFGVMRCISKDLNECNDNRERGMRIRLIVKFHQYSDFDGEERRRVI